MIILSDKKIVYDQFIHNFRIAFNDKGIGTYLVHTPTHIFIGLCDRYDILIRESNPPQ